MPHLRLLLSSAEDLSAIAVQNLSAKAEKIVEFADRTEELSPILELDFSILNLNNVEPFDNKNCELLVHRSRILLAFAYNMSTGWL